ncbi:hypothetical protein BDZ88DRAFT_438200 [Geranomyces variabilis]|nr:hypothetical protein BDZ88DRAFT_438200 [Geranomyces variabilis]
MVDGRPQVCESWRDKNAAQPPHCHRRKQTVLPTFHRNNERRRKPPGALSNSLKIMPPTAKGSKELPKNLPAWTAKTAEVCEFVRALAVQDVKTWRIEFQLTLQKGCSPPGLHRPFRQPHGEGSRRSGEAQHQPKPTAASSLPNGQRQPGFSELLHRNSHKSQGCQGQHVARRSRPALLRPSSALNKTGGNLEAHAEWQTADAEHAVANIHYGHRTYVGESQRMQGAPAAISKDVSAKQRQPLRPSSSTTEGISLVPNSCREAETLGVLVTAISVDAASASGLVYEADTKFGAVAFFGPRGEKRYEMKGGKRAPHTSSTCFTSRRSWRDASSNCRGSPAFASSPTERPRQKVRLPDETLQFTCVSRSGVRHVDRCLTWRLAISGSLLVERSCIVRSRELIADVERKRVGPGRATWSSPWPCGPPPHAQPPNLVIKERPPSHPPLSFLHSS